MISSSDSSSFDLSENDKKFLDDTWGHLNKIGGLSEEEKAELLRQEVEENLSSPTVEQVDEFIREKLGRRIPRAN